MDKNKSNLTKPDNEKKAQADSSPELYSVLDEFQNGTDLQPLENIEQEEFIDFEYNIIGNPSAEDSSDKKVDKSFSFSDKEKRPFIKPGLIRFFIVILLIAGVFVGIYMVFFHQDYFSYCAKAVYEKDNSVNVILENKDVLRLGEVFQVKLSDDGNILVYSQDSDSKTGKYDIRVIDFSKRTSVKNKGSIIVNGIDSEWTTDKNADFIYYQKTENKSTKYYMYSTESRETQLVVADALEFFIPPAGDIVYYTREHGDKTTLYRTRFGETAESLGEANNIKMVSNNDIMEIFFTVADKDVESNSFTLYKISGDKEKIKISDNVSEVYLDNYTPGGNLYYFVNNEAKLNWNDFVEDSYFDSDMILSAPVKGSYLKTVGFFFKRTVLDEQSYNRAKEDYNKKLLRDEIREALDKLDLGLAVSAEYKVKAYDGQLSKELAGSVKLENLIAFAETGAPRIIYKTTGIDSDKKIKIDELYNIAYSKTVDDAMDYVIDNLDNNYHISKGFKYSWYDGNKVTSLDFNPINDDSDATFTFADRNTIVTCVKATDTLSSLYISSVGEKEIASSVLISENVVTFDADSNGIYYTRQADESTDLYFSNCSGDSLMLCQSNIQYMITDSGKVIAIKGNAQSIADDKVEILLYEDGKVKTVDKDVSFRHFELDGDTFAYIKDYQSAAASDNETPEGGELSVYSGGDTVVIDSPVSRIYDINYN